MSLFRKWGAHFLVLELASALIVVIALIAWSEAFGRHEGLNRFLAAHGETLYVVVAPIAAALLGFILAAAAIVVTAAPAARMTLLRESAHYEDLWKCFRSAMRFLGFAALSAIAAIGVTGETASRVLFYLTTALSLSASVRVGRCVWAMNWVIRIFTGPSLAEEVEG